jgi:hypothetical protein
MGKRKIIETRPFAKDLQALIRKRSLLNSDYEEFKDELGKNPDMGDLVKGAGGIRKTRLKSATRGKSGGFRVCYYFLVSRDFIYLLWIFPKNEQDNLTAEEKGILKEIASQIKRDNP